MAPRPHSFADTSASPCGFVHSHFRLLTYGRSYKALAPKTRMLLGIGLMANAGLALQFSDRIEAALGMSPPPSERQKLQDILPRVSAVERGPK